MSKLTYTLPVVNNVVVDKVTKDLHERYADLASVSPSDVAFVFITSGHDIFMSMFPDLAEKFVQAGQEAIDNILKIVKKETVDG